MGQTLGDFLKITSADDYFMINVHKDKKTVYFGYENEVLECFYYILKRQIRGNVYETNIFVRQAKRNRRKHSETVEKQWVYGERCPGSHGI